MTYVSEGQVVLAPVGQEGAMLRVVVCAAMGHTARVVNEMHRIDAWVPVADLRAVPREKGRKP